MLILKSKCSIYLYLFVLSLLVSPIFPFIPLHGQSLSKLHPINSYESYSKFVFRYGTICRLAKKNSNDIHHKNVNNDTLKDNLLKYFNWSKTKPISATDNTDQQQSSDQSISTLSLPFRETLSALSSSIDQSLNGKRKKKASSVTQKRKRVDENLLLTSSSSLISDQSANLSNLSHHQINPNRKEEDGISLNIFENFSTSSLPTKPPLNNHNHHTTTTTTKDHEVLQDNKKIETEQSANIIKQNIIMTASNASCIESNETTATAATAVNNNTANSSWFTLLTSPFPLSFFSKSPPPMVNYSLPISNNDTSISDQIIISDSIVTNSDSNSDAIGNGDMEGDEDDEDLPIEIQSELSSSSLSLSSEEEEEQNARDVTEEDSNEIVDIGSSTGWNLFYHILPTSIANKTASSNTSHASNSSPILDPDNDNDSDDAEEEEEEEVDMHAIRKSAFLYGLPITITPPVTNNNNTASSTSHTTNTTMPSHYTRNTYLTTFHPKYHHNATDTTNTTSMLSNMTCPRLPFPSAGDLHYLYHLQTQSAIETALHIQSAMDCEHFLECISITTLIDYILMKENTTWLPFLTTEQSRYTPIDAIKAINRVMSYDKHMIDTVFGSTNNADEVKIAQFYDRVSEILTLPFQYRLTKGKGKRFPRLPRASSCSKPALNDHNQSQNLVVLPSLQYQDYYTSLYTHYILSSSPSSCKKPTRSVQNNTSSAPIRCIKAPKISKPKKPTRYEQYLLSQEESYRGQHEAVALIQRMVRHGSTATIQHMKGHEKLRMALRQVMQAPPHIADHLKPPVSTTTQQHDLTEHNNHNNHEHANKSKQQPTPHAAAAPHSIASIASSFFPNLWASKPSPDPSNPLHAFQTPNRLTTAGPTRMVEPIQLSYEDTQSEKTFVHQAKNTSTIIEYVNLKPCQMAKVALAGIGGLPWTPKRPNQRGIRILSFDGGGTRGVISVALLKAIFTRLQQLELASLRDVSSPSSSPVISPSCRPSRALKSSRSKLNNSQEELPRATAAATTPEEDEDLLSQSSSSASPANSSSSIMPLPRPCEYFDLICGTSTGGIIAMLLGAYCHSIETTEQLYDDFIAQVFRDKSSLKLVTSKAFYDAKHFESIIYKMCGDAILLDSQHQPHATNVFCVSTQMNALPPKTFLWRNYDYPDSMNGDAKKGTRFPGSCQASTLTAIRATSAAPTFFTPVIYDNQLFSDGALIANNPTAIAIQEAKTLYPGVPIELVVSIGTGLCKETSSNIQTMGWDYLVNQLIASTTDTEQIHSLLQDFLPADTYYRFNPVLPNNPAIDEKTKSILESLKENSQEYYRDLERVEMEEFQKNLVANRSSSVSKEEEEEEEEDSNDDEGDDEEEVEQSPSSSSSVASIGRLAGMIKKLYGKK